MRDSVILFVFVLFATFDVWWKSIDVPNSARRSRAAVSVTGSGMGAVPAATAVCRAALLAGSATVHAMLISISNIIAVIASLFAEIDFDEIFRSIF